MAGPLFFPPSLVSQGELRVLVGLDLSLWRSSFLLRLFFPRTLKFLPFPLAVQFEYSALYLFFLSFFSFDS